MTLSLADLQRLAGATGFRIDVPRLSVDIDLNYIGAVDRATMETERPLVERGLQAACERSGVSVKRIQTEHAGGKWRLKTSQRTRSTRIHSADLVIGVTGWWR